MNAKIVLIATLLILATLGSLPSVSSVGMRISGALLPTWWIEDFWAPNHAGSVTGMGGRFTAIDNSMGSLTYGNVMVIPLNIAYGSSTNLIWIQFIIYFGWTVPIVQGDWVVQKWDAPNGCPIPFGLDWIAETTPVGVDYVAGHTYHYSIGPSGSQVIFTIVDETSNTGWSKYYTPPSTSVVHHDNCFSPASVIEGTTTPSSLSDVPYFPFTVTVDGCDNSAACNLDFGGVSSGVPVPQGMTTYKALTATPGRWHWAMTSGDYLQGHNSIPKPSIDWSLSSFTPSVTVGQTATIDIVGKNTGGPAAWQTISISFPDNIAGSITVDPTSTLGNARAYNVGEPLTSCYSDCGTVATRYPVVEGSKAPWGSNEAYHLKVKITPTVVGTVRFLVKSVAALVNQACSWYPEYSTVVDQQTEFAVDKTDSQSPLQIVVAPTSSYVAHVSSAPSSSVSISYSGTYSGTKATPFDIGPYPSSFTVTLTAPQADGTHAFDYWVLDTNNMGTSRSLTVTVDDTHKDRNAVAIYATSKPVEYYIFVGASPSDKVTGVTISYSGSYSGSRATGFELPSPHASAPFTASLTAPSSYNGYDFSYWLLDGMNKGGNNLYVDFSSSHVQETDTKILYYRYATAVYSTGSYTTTTLWKTGTETSQTTQWDWRTTYIATTSTYTVSGITYSPTYTQTATQTMYVMLYTTTTQTITTTVTVSTGSLGGAAIGMQESSSDMPTQANMFAALYAVVLSGLGISALRFSFGSGSIRIGRRRDYET